VGAHRARGGAVLNVYRVRLGDEEARVTVEETSGVLRVRIAAAMYEVDVAEVVPGWYSLVVDGRCHDLGAQGPAERRTLILDGATFAAEVDRASPADREGPARRPPRRRTDEVRAPMPGLLVEVHAREGTEVAMGAALIIMEAMKMQMEIRAPHAAMVRRVHVAPGQEVAQGQVLVTLE